MSDYNLFPGQFKIKAGALLKVLQEAADGGYSFYVVINGMHYDIDMGEIPHKKPDDIF